MTTAMARPDLIRIFMGDRGQFVVAYYDESRCVGVVEGEPDELRHTLAARYGVWLRHGRTRIHTLDRKFHWDLHSWIDLGQAKRPPLAHRHRRRPS